MPLPPVCARALRARWLCFVFAAGTSLGCKAEPEASCDAALDRLVTLKVDQATNHPSLRDNAAVRNRAAMTARTALLPVSRKRCAASETYAKCVTESETLNQAENCQ
ncbi:MAG: hypothetical protein AB7S68_27045 [Polyangiaceae bacterium]